MSGVDIIVRMKMDFRYDKLTWTRHAVGIDNILGQYLGPLPFPSIPSYWGNKWAYSITNLCVASFVAV
ncbi:hypothetical protein ACHAWO_000929 [Cyclotella atomus]|uniref:Uncharacterized protein n=1 Tax=Cyclotella atomus TaxID=382360 RepID=A0ABD3N349_9STRA